MPELLSNRYVTLTLEHNDRVVRFGRTDRPYDAVDDVTRLHEELGRRLDQAGRRGRSLLVDMRLAQMNIDPEFEHRAMKARHHLVRDFDRVAVLVATAVGALQVRRHIREDGRDIPVFQDEAEAISFLTRMESVRPPPSAREPSSGRMPSSSRNPPSSKAGSPTSATKRRPSRP